MNAGVTKAADDTVLLDWLEANALRQGTDMGTAVDLIMRVPVMRRGGYHSRNGGEFKHATLRDAIRAAMARAKA